MTAATDCIVLLSSPEHDAICAPPVVDEEIKSASLLTASIASPAPPAKVSRPPTRSRFFATPEPKSTKAKDVRTGRRPTTASSEDTVKGKTTRKGRKPKDGAQAEVQDLVSEVPENKENATKPKRTRKKQEVTATGGEKLKNKTITGKVSKTGTTRPRKPDAKPAVGESTPKRTAHRLIAGEEHKDFEKGLQLEAAVKRRLDWTPTKDTAKSGTEQEDGNDTKSGRSGLGLILSGYEYDGSSTGADRDQVIAGEGPIKRRRIELVDPRVLPAKPKPLNDGFTEISEEEAEISVAAKTKKKPKPRAKRITTLTGRMTALYQRSTSPDSEIQGTLPLTEDSTATKSEARKFKKTDENSGFKFPSTFVLPPDVAVRSLDQQDLVFGTCSQLESEDSPTLLKDTQAALRESEKELSTASSSCSDELSRFTRSSTAISRLAPSRNLWSVAARDTEGAVVNVEVVDLIDSPEAPKVTPPTDAVVQEKELEQTAARETSKQASVPPMETSNPESIFVNEDIPVSTTQTVEAATNDKPKALTKKPMPHYKFKTDLELAKEIKGYGLKAMKSRKAMIEVLEKCWVAKHGPVTQGDAEELCRERTSSAAPVSEKQKLDEDSKKPEGASQTRAKVQSKAKSKSSNTANESIGATATTTTTAATTELIVDLELNSQPPAKRSFMDVEEIQDSEDEDFLPSPTSILNQFLQNSPEKEGLGKKQKTHELSILTVPSSPVRSPQRKPPSPRPSRATKLKAKPKPKTTRSTTTTTTEATSNPNLPDLATQITKAVRAQPRQGQSPSGKPIRPSWHEKILMYDPIYLEDFTAWLNTEGLGLVDEDREVGMGFVREWCEMKGICCCFRVRRGVGHY
ncbi:hypothetical protein BDV06DRAFT_202432 [Aspergillus oleicola]